MEKEDRKYLVVDGRYKISFHDVWLAIDEGVLWQPEEGKQQAESFEWTNMVLVFYFPK